MFHPNSDWPQLAALGSASPMMSPFFVRPYPHTFDLNWLTMHAAAVRRFPTPVLPYPQMMMGSPTNRTMIRPIATINSNSSSSRRSSFSVDNLLNHFNVERSETKTPPNQPKAIELKIYDSENDSEGTLVCKKRRFNVHQREGMKIANDMDLQLPKDLKFVHMTIADVDYCGVFCANDSGIQCNKRYGPLIQNAIVHSSNEPQSSTEVENAWMNYVLNTLDENQANLVKLTDVDKIYFEVSKTILVGEQLFVLEFLEKPISTPKSLLSEKLRTMDDDSNSILPDSQSDVTKPGSSEASADDAGETKGFQCERCGKVFSYKYYRDKHLKYTRCVDKGDRKFPCHLCTRSFEKRDRLRIHILHVHEKHRPHCCTVCGKRFSQSSSLNKHLRVHSGERPYKCVYCSKAFTASSILRTHIRQHSGEKPFKCKFCGKAFASHAAHDSHVRRTHTAPKPETHNCPLCKKSFQHSSHLKFHLQCIHGNWSMLSDREASVV